MYSLGLVVVFLLLLWMRWWRWKRYWAVRGVPYMPPLPVLGNVLQLARFNASIVLKRLHGKYKSPYVGMWFFWRPALVVNCPEIANRILIKDSIHFRERYVRSSENDIIGKNILFSLKEPLWSSMRRRADVVFTSPKTIKLYETKQNKVYDLFFRIKREMSEKKRVNLKGVVNDYTVDVIGSAISGTASNSTLYGEGNLRTLLQQLVDFDLSRKITWIVAFFYPSLRDTFLYKRPEAFPPAATAELRRIYHTVLKERGGYEAEITEQEDLVDVLRKLKKDCSEAGTEVPEELLVAQCVLFLQAGIDAVANNLAYCLYELAYNQSVQDKLYEEVSQVKYKNGEHYMDAADLLHLTYLKSVVNETLRKYSQLGWLDRVAASTYKVDEKLTIPAGTPILINSIGMRYDPALFPEPEKFIPERFLTEDGSVKSPCAYLPFGEGPRACIGKRLSLIVLRHTIASVVREFKIRSLPNTVSPSEATIARNSLFYLPGRPLLVHFERRL